MPANVFEPNKDISLRVAERTAAWKTAETLVNPVIEQHGLSEFSSGAAFLAPGSTVTPVDQHIDQLMRVSDWLLEP